MYRLFLLLSIIGFSKIIKAQPEFDWATSPGCTSGASDIAIGQSGNTYTIGSFIGTGDFDPGTGVFNLTSVGNSNPWSNLQSDYIQKLDPSGNLIWAKMLPYHCNRLAVDDQENIYIVGTFWGTEDFNPGNGVSNLTAIGHNDFFILKLDVNGDFLWVKSIGSQYGDIGDGIAIDPAGNILTIMNYKDVCSINTLSGPQTLPHSSVSTSDLCVIKFTPNGDIIWAKAIGGTSDEIGNSIKTDQQGNVYTSGYYTWTVDFDPGTGVFNMSSSNGGCFIQKLDTNGDFVWAKSVETNGSFYNGFVVDIDSQGNTYLYGSFEGANVDFNPDPNGTYFLSSTGVPDLFIIKLDISGSFEWAKSIGNGTTAYSAWMHIGVDDYIYMSGMYDGTVDFDPGPTNFNLVSTNNTNPDLFILSLDSNGDFIWAESIGGTAFEWPSVLKTDECNDIYHVGAFQGTCDFDPGTAVYNLSSSSGFEGYISRLSNKVHRTDTIEACAPYIWMDGLTYTTDNYTAEYEVQGMCDSLITLHLTITTDLIVDLGEDTLVCDGGQFMLDAFNNGASYVWSDNSSNATFNVSQSGTYYVEVSDGSCSVTDTIEVVYGTPPSEVDAGPDQLVCPGIYVTLNGAGAETYSWSHEVEDGVPFIPVSTDTYTLTGASIEGCTATDEVTVELREIEAKFSYSPVVIEITDPEVTFTNQSINAISYQWTFGEGGTSTEEHPVYIYAEPGIYPVQLIAISDAGCVDTALAHLDIRDLPYFFVPNTFTPNNDGVNDTFLPSLAGSLPSEYELLVYDKWGRVVFQSNDIYASWDGTHKGTPCPVDTYVWVINMVGQYDVENTTERGHVNLIR